MPVHDWSRVPAGFFHDVHHAWIEELKRALNGGVLPPDYYAMAEPFAGGFGPDVITLQGGDGGDSTGSAGNGPGRGGLALAEPRIAVTAETEMEFYRRKQSSVAVRHVSDDRVVAIVEVVSPANKNNRVGIEPFVRKAAALLSGGVHLLLLDLLPPGPRDPRGTHSLIWEHVAGAEPSPPERPLTLAAYEADLALRAYVVPVAVGDPLPEMPLFLEPRGCVEVPLEATYASAVAVFPRRWRHLLEPTTR
jgi:hypothetical protein